VQYLEREVMQAKLKIAFIGGGNMASALIGGVVEKLTDAANIHVVDPNPASLKKLACSFGVGTASCIDKIFEDVDVIILAVKPQQLREVLIELAPFLSGQLLLSIAAGIRAADMSRWLNGYDQIVRTMPNTPALIGMGITGLVAMSGVNAVQKQAAQDIMQAVGATVWLDDEGLIDAVTAVSGSGPAYVFYFIEAMQQAAAELGLSQEQGTELAIATFSGAAQLAVRSDEAISVLRERVTSKGGTTYAALRSMEENGVKAAIVQAVRAAARRGKELGDEFGAQI
jgi:pyrroline-5-carboxylate reductase